MWLCLSLANISSLACAGSTFLCSCDDSDVSIYRQVDVPELLDGVYKGYFSPTSETLVPSLLQGTQINHLKKLKKPKKLITLHGLA
jgi:hypothetical protein